MLFFLGGGKLSNLFEVRILDFFDRDIHVSFDMVVFVSCLQHISCLLLNSLYNISSLAVLSFSFHFKG